MIVMQYASGVDLHNWLQKNFEKFTWNKEKLIILWQISEGYYIRLFYCNYSMLNFN
jgi:hypothetical protein